MASLSVPKKDMHFLDMPDIILMEILEYVSYDEISKKRLVCRRFDEVCQRILNCGFNKAVRQHSISFKRIKALLPRRESERRNHCLARHADILTSIETRISMLSMTYNKYIDLNLCCFIPGRVLDEIFRILNMISKTTRQLRPHEVLQELRDISSMAIEHFDEKIVNTLRKSYADSKGKGGPSNATENKSPIFPSTSVSFSGLGLGPSTSINLASTAILNTIRSPTAALHGIELSPLRDASLGIPVHHHSEPIICAEGRIAMIKYKALEARCKKGVITMRRLQQKQLHTSRRLQQVLSENTELIVQVAELKKRVEDLDSKYCEMSANMKHIMSGEPPAVPGETKDETEAVIIASTTPVTATKRRHYDDPPSPPSGSNGALKKMTKLTKKRR